MNQYLRPMTTLFVAILFAVSASAETGDSTRYLTFKDTLLLFINADGDKFIEHTVIKGQTLFSLAKFYSLNIDELYPHNLQLKDTSVPIGTKVKIPIPNRAIMRFKNAEFKNWKYANLYYVVQKGDNLFNIAKTQFHMPVDSVMKRNGLKTQTLTPGQRLHVGWISTAGVPEGERVASASVSKPWSKSDELKKNYGRKGKRNDGKGVAFWQKNGIQNSDLYCLHRTAKRGTIIACTNPSTGRTAYCKVIGTLPVGAYPDEVQLVVSPTVAKLLGAVDARFYVKFSFYQ